MIKKLKLIPELGKIRIALPVSLSAFTGYLAGNQGWDQGVWPLIAGIFILAMGASALNQVQEYRFDIRMKRTQHRPIPSGRIMPIPALIISLILIAGGSVVLHLGSGQQAMFLGLMTIFWYNILYTYLKRLTAFAVVPGSVVGALPPLIGWSASDGNIESTAAISLAVFFFIGQIPHFWLIILSIGKQYEEAGYPSLSGVLNKRQIGSLTLVWIVATGIMALFLPLNHTIQTAWMSWVLVIAVVRLFWGFFRLARPSVADINAKKGFLKLNLFFLMVMVIIWIDVLIF